MTHICRYGGHNVPKMSGVKMPRKRRPKSDSENLLSVRHSSRYGSLQLVPAVAHLPNSRVISSSLYAWPSLALSESHTLTNLSCM